MTNYNTIFDMLRGQYNFSKDLKSNHPHEDWIVNHVMNSNLAAFAELVDSTDKVNRKVFDIQTKDPAHLIEVKKDLFCFRSGNIFFETESRNQFSGILTTKSDWWAQSYLCSDGKFRTGIAETEEVKKTIFMPGYRKLNGGDKGKSGSGVAKGVIVPWKDYEAICFHTFELDALDYITAIGLLDEYNKKINKTTTKEDLAW